MAEVVGLLLVAAFIGGTARFAAHVYQGLKTEGVLPLPRIPKAARAHGKKRLPVKEHAFRTRARVQRTGRTASVIAAEVITTNWPIHRPRRRERATPAPEPARPPRRRWGHPPKDEAAPSAAKPAAKATKAPDTPPHAPDSHATDSHATVPPSATTGGTPMTTPASTGGASSDFFSALNRVIAEARAGNIRAKARANLVMGEGFVQMGTALEQYAKELQESGQYPAHVWEPVLQGAGMARGAAAHLTESGNAVSEIARTPAGELAGKAPHRDELNKA